MDSPPSDPIDLALLDRFLSGRCSPAEREAVARWAAAHPTHRALVTSLEQLFAPLGRPRPLDVEEIVSGLRRRRVAALRQETGEGAAESRSHLRPGLRLAPSRRWGARVAAGMGATLIVAGAALLGYRRVARPHLAASRPAAVREIATGRGQRAELRLADGSRVVLAPASRLEIPPENERDVVLTGEAYFDVVHDSTHPFRVRTAAGTVEDLGTAFVVTAYPETDGTRVVVASGAVALRPMVAPGGGGVSTPLTRLARGDVAHLDRAGHVALRHQVSLSPYLGWTTGRLAFDGVRLAEAVPVLERWYDITIQLRDTTLAAERFVAVFDNEATADALQRIALALGARVERRGRVAVFSRRGSLLQPR
jgi:transmembrane sensor